MWVFRKGQAYEHLSSQFFLYLAEYAYMHANEVGRFWGWSVVKIISRVGTATGIHILDSFLIFLEEKNLKIKKLGKISLILKFERGAAILLICLYYPFE